MPSLQSMPKIGYREKEAAAYVGVSVTTFRAWVNAGMMPQPAWIGGCKLYRADALVDHFDRLTANAAHDKSDEDPWGDVLGGQRGA